MAMRESGGHVLKAFLSSSMEELKELREALATALDRIGVTAWRWEADDAAGASPNSIRRRYVEKLEDSDIYIGLFGRKYGQWTIDEYENAAARKKPCFIYASEPREDAMRDRRLAEFLARRQEVADPGGVTIGWFKSTEHMVDMVTKDIDEWRAPATRGRRVVPQDPFDWERLRKLLDARSSDTLSLPAYNRKFDSRRYVPRRAVEKQVFDFLSDHGGPLKFMVAESGRGKTCFIRHLSLQLANNSDGGSWATLILRGLSAGIDRPDGLQSYLSGIIASEFNIPDESRQEALVRLDRWLWTIQRGVLVIVDGVNEAEKTRAVFSSIVDVVERLTFCARREGRKTRVKLLVTSRRLAFDSFMFQDQAGERLEGVLRMAGESRIDEPIQVAMLSPEELNEGLLKAGLSTALDGKQHLREVLSDPLLLGYFCDMSATGESVADVKTPLDLFKSVWALQAKALQDQIKGTALDPVARVVEICRSMLAEVSDQTSPEWSADDRQVMVTNVLVFEEVRDGEGRVRSVRFRYDRMAHYLIARYAVLSDERGHWRDSHAVVGVLVRTVVLGKGGRAMVLPDVIRSALVTSVVSLFEREFANHAMAVPTVLGLLDPPQALFEGCNLGVRGAVMLELGEIAYDALVEAARWDAKAVVDFLLEWFSRHPTELESAIAGVLRRVAFNLLLSTSHPGHSDSRIEDTGNAANSAITSARAGGPPGGGIDDESKSRLCMLGGEALLTDATGDTCVLLYALYAGGADQTALEVIRVAIRRIFEGERRWRPKSWKDGFIGIALAMILIFPLAEPMPAEFLERIRELFRKFPPLVVGMGLAAIADAAFDANVMPVRAEQWLALVQKAPSRRLFRKTLLLLQVRDCDRPLLADWSSIAQAMQMVRSSRNAFITQLLTHAVSCRIACVNGPTRRTLLDDLGAQVCELQATIDEAIARGELRDDSGDGLVGYALSLVCYHLLVFDIKALRREEVDEVFGLMETLATKVLLVPPLMGRFKIQPGGRVETSNIIGTFGRAALAVGRPERFKDMIAALCSQYGGRGLQRSPDFTAFLFESFGTLGTLSADPSLALEALHRLGKTLGYFQRKADEHSPAQAKNSSRSAMLESLLQIRDLHPFAVEQHLKTHLEKEDAYFLIETIRAARNDSRRDATGNLLRNGILSRHLSWVFEHVTEKIVLVHPPVCRIMAADIVRRLSPGGLKSLCISVALRLARFTRGREARVLTSGERVALVALSGLVSILEPLARRLLVALSKAPP